MVTAAAHRSRDYRALFDDTFGAGFEAEQLLDDANSTRIPVLTSASVVAHARDMCTRPTDELDTGSTGGSSGKPVKFYLDRNRSPVEYAFVHDAWARAGFRAGDPRCVFRGVELSNADETHMQYDPALAELRCSVFHLTDATMRGYYDESGAEEIRGKNCNRRWIAMDKADPAVDDLLAPLAQIAGVVPTSERLRWRSV